MTAEAPYNSARIWAIDKLISGNRAIIIWTERLAPFSFYEMGVNAGAKLRTVWQRRDTLSLLWHSVLCRLSLDAAHQPQTRDIPVTLVIACRPI